MKLHVSPKNSKMGKIPSVSLLPVVTCGGVPCTKQCYARKLSKLYKNAYLCWAENTNYAYVHIAGFFIEVADWLIQNRPDKFRWHVSGDIPSLDYLNRMITIAEDFPDIRFMAFTKRFEFLEKCIYIPDNLTIIRSMWPYMKNPDQPGKRAWVRGDLRAPADAKRCSGTCDTCMHCWENDGRDVLLEMH